MSGLILEFFFKRMLNVLKVILIDFFEMYRFNGVIFNIYLVIF